MGEGVEQRQRGCRVESCRDVNVVVDNDQVVYTPLLSYRWEVMQTAALLVAGKAKFDSRIVGEYSCADGGDERCRVDGCDNVADDEDKEKRPGAGHTTR